MLKYTRPTTRGGGGDIVAVVVIGVGDGTGWAVGYLETPPEVQGVNYNIIHTGGTGRIMPKAPRRRPAGGAGAATV